MKTQQHSIALEKLDAIDTADSLAYRAHNTLELYSDAIRAYNTDARAFTTYKHIELKALELHVLYLSGNAARVLRDASAAMVRINNQIAAVRLADGFTTNAELITIAHNAQQLARFFRTEQDAQ